MHIALIDPILSGGWERDPLPPIEGVVVSRSFIDIGPSSVESRLDDDLAAAGVLDRAIQAQQSGADAIVVNCMNDPGVEPAREVVDIPVIGTMEASTHLAAHLGASFAIITTGQDDIPVVHELLDHLEVSARCSSVRALGLPVLELGADSETTYARYLSAAIDAIETDRTAVLIPGCTVLARYADRLQRDLLTRGTPIVVVEPIEAALHQAVTLTRLGIRHSPVVYPTAPVGPARRSPAAVGGQIQ